jgi:hypothetical protein
MIYNNSNTLSDLSKLSKINRIIIMIAPFRTSVFSSDIYNRDGRSGSYGVNCSGIGHSILPEKPLRGNDATHTSVAALDAG